MQRLEVSGAVRLICRSLGVKGLNKVKYNPHVNTQLLINQDNIICNVAMQLSCNKTISINYTTPALHLHNTGYQRLQNRTWNM